MTRPRLSSSTTVWMMVLLAVTRTIMAKPEKKRMARERPREREKENAAMQTPKRAGETTSRRFRPRTLRLDARYSAATKEPVPVAVMRNPKVCGPPSKTSLANTGSRMT